MANWKRRNKTVPISSQYDYDISNPKEYTQKLLELINELAMPMDTRLNAKINHTS